MFRTYKLTSTKTRYTPILEVIRRRAIELEREAAEQQVEARRTRIQHPFRALD